MFIMKYCLVFILLIVLIVSCAENTAEKGWELRQTPDAAEYQLAAVEKLAVTSTIKLPAQLTAYEEVSILPKVNGYVRKVLVDIGSRVNRGDLLMVLEAPELQQASLQAKEKYTKARADLSIDKERYQRLLEASKTEGAISPMDLSTVKSKMSADSALCNAEKANWHAQETMMGYLRVTAPFTGVITERNVNPGALVSASAKDRPMLELKQVDRLRLQVDIPEDVIGSIRSKDTLSFITSAYPGKKMIGNISRRSGNVNPQYRSERIEADVQNKQGLLTPGMYAEVVLSSKGNANALSVPKSAVVTTTERKYVLVDREGKIKKVDVITGNTSENTVEVYGRLQVGDSIIRNATDDIKERL